MALLLQTFKTSGADGYPPEWSNSYVIDSSIDPQGEPGRIIMDSVIEAERIIHLPHVIFTRASLQTYGPATAAPIVPQVGILSGGNRAGLRENATGEVLPFLWKLQFIKRVAQGRTGRLWYSGCLTSDDVSKETDDRWHLINPHLWHDLVNTWYMYHFGPVLNQLVVPIGAGGNRQATGFRSVSNLMASAVIMSNAMARSRARVKPNSLAAFNQQRTMATLAAKNYQELLDWLWMEVEFNPPELKQKALAVVTGAKATSEQLAEYLKDADLNDNNGEVPPVVRYGPTSAAIRQICLACGQITEEDLETLNEIQPYNFVQDQWYLHFDDLETLAEITKKYVAYVGLWSEFDWLNPDAYEESAV